MYIQKESQKFLESVPTDPVGIEEVCKGITSIEALGRKLEKSPNTISQWISQGYMSKLFMAYVQENYERERFTITNKNNQNETYDLRKITLEDTKKIAEGCKTVADIEEKFGVAKNFFEKMKNKYLIQYDWIKRAVCDNRSKIIRTYIKPEISVEAEKSAAEVEREIKIEKEIKDASEKYRIKTTIGRTVIEEFMTEKEIDEIATELMGLAEDIRNNKGKIAKCNCGGLARLISESGKKYTAYRVECIACNEWNTITKSAETAIESWNSANR